MRGKSIIAVFDNNLPVNLHLNSFQDCTNFVVDNLAKETGPFQYFLWTVPVVYLLGDVVYSIVILRLFVSNVLKLAVFTSEIKPKSKHRKNQNLNMKVCF